MSAYEPRDAAYRRARQRGYRSRAALKLEEIDRKFHLFRPGQCVLDLGCWPGGWLQVAAARVGMTGRVVGLDLRDTELLSLPQVTTLMGDVALPAVRCALEGALGGAADVVLSDMAPKLSGVALRDQQRHLALVELATELAADLLKQRGRAVIKLFDSGCDDAILLARSRFGQVWRYRPPSTRKRSSELYAVLAAPRPRADKPGANDDAGKEQGA